MCFSASLFRLVYIWAYGHVAAVSPLNVSQVTKGHRTLTDR